MQVFPENPQSQSNSIPFEKMNQLARHVYHEELEKKQQAVKPLQEKLVAAQLKLSVAENALAEQVKIIQEKLATQIEDPERRARMLAVQTRGLEAGLTLLKMNVSSISDQIKTTQNPTSIVYQDDHMVILTGAMIPQEKVSLESQKSIAGDAIKFVATGDNVHFIQFVTHQTVDFRETASSELTTMETPSTESASAQQPVFGHPANYFTVNPTQPQWRVDGGASSDKTQLSDPYYDSYGVHDKKLGLLSIYDEPGTTMSQTERIGFVTYLIKDNQATSEIQWARQMDENGKFFYQIGTVQPIKELPDWAILTIKNDLFQANSDHKHALTYELPKELDRPVKLETATMKPLETSLLPPPQNWCTVKLYPQLFPDVNKQPLPTEELKFST